MSGARVNPEVADILVVEDNPADALLLREAFKEVKFPHQLHIVMNGQDALVFLRREQDHVDAPRPDLILLDLNLPGKNGHDVLQEMKGDDSLRRIPVVVFTSSPSEEDILHCYNQCANAYMNKVYEFDRLVELVHATCNYWFGVVRLPPRE